MHKKYPEIVPEIFKFELISDNDVKRQFRYQKIINIVVVSFSFEIKHSYNMITNSFLVKMINLTLFKISLAIITVYVFTKLVFG